MDEPLSEREIDILRLAADGRANGEIAGRLALSLNTVKWYNKRIYEKLAVENRTQAIKRAQTLGLLNGDDGQAAPALAHHNLPSPLTTFVGRRAEVDAVKQLLQAAPAADPDGAGRHWENAAGPASGRGDDRALQRRRLLRGPGADQRSALSRKYDRSCAWGGRITRYAAPGADQGSTAKQAVAARPGQL